MQPGADAAHIPDLTMLVLPPELTHRQAAACLRMLVQGLKTHREGAVVVDANALKVFDTSALAVLLECRRAAVAERKGLVVKAMPAGLASLAGLYGVQELLPVV